MQPMRSLTICSTSLFLGIEATEVIRLSFAHDARHEALSAAIGAFLFQVAVNYVLALRRNAEVFGTAVIQAVSVSMIDYTPVAMLKTHQKAMHADSSDAALSVSLPRINARLRIYVTAFHAHNAPRVLPDQIEIAVIDQNNATGNCEFHSTNPLDRKNRTIRSIETTVIPAYMSYALLTSLVHITRRRLRIVGSCCAIDQSVLAVGRVDRFEGNYDAVFFGEFDEPLDGLGGRHRSTLFELRDSRLRNADGHTQIVLGNLQTFTEL